MTRDVLNSYRLPPGLTPKETISNWYFDRRRRIDGQVAVITMTRTVGTSRSRTRLGAQTPIWREPMSKEVQLAAAWSGDVGQHMLLENGGFLT